MLAGTLPDAPPDQAAAFTNANAHARDIMKYRA